jgi:hypothetical protein
VDDDDNSHNLIFIHDFLLKKWGAGVGGRFWWGFQSRFYYPNCKQQEPKNERKGQVPILLWDQFSRYTKPHGFMDK